MTRGAWRVARAVRLALAIGVAVLESARQERPASAQLGASARARRTVEVRVAGRDGSRLEDSLRELLGRLALLMESRQSFGSEPERAATPGTWGPSLLARVTVDLRDPARAVVSVVDGATGSVSLHRTVGRNASASVESEELAHIVQAALEPMLLRERDVALEVEAQAGISAPTATVPVSPALLASRRLNPTSHVPLDVLVPPAPSLPSAWALELSPEAGVSSYARGAGVIARMGCDIGLVHRRGLRPSIHGSAHYVVPFEVGSEVVRAHVSVSAFRAAVALELIQRASFALDVAAGVGVDALTVEPRSDVLPVGRLAAATSRLDPLALTKAVAHIPLTRGTALSLSVGADIDLASRRWIVASDRGLVSDVFLPSRIRLMTMLGITFAALGDAVFGPREAAP